MIGVMLIKNGYVIIYKKITLDTFTTYSVINKLNYVEYANNCAKHKELVVLKNGGSLLFDPKRSLKILPLNIHENYNSIETIITLKYVNNTPGVRLTMYTLV